MKSTLIKARQRIRDSRLGDTRLGVRLANHREFVGGRWDEMGDKQFGFLREQGLRPEDVLLDVGCGALRGGRHFIAYLDAGHYVGVDKHEPILMAGVKKELDPAVREAKAPRLHVADRFQIPPLDPAPTFALAQSLFSHLTHEDARLCLERVRAVAADGCRFFVTFHECAVPQPAADVSHSRRRYEFTRGEMEAMGREAGWTPRYIGDWGHPRGQRMIEYVAA